MSSTSWANDNSPGKPWEPRVIWHYLKSVSDSQKCAALFTHCHFIRCITLNFIHFDWKQDYGKAKRDILYRDQWQIEGGGGGLATKFFSILCSFRENLIKLYPSTPLTEGWRPLRGKSWIRHCAIFHILHWDCPPPRLGTSLNFLWLAVAGPGFPWGGHQS